MNKVIEFCNGFSSVKWVLFDMFDTVVHRKCNPEYIKKLWAKMLVYEFAINLSSEELYRIRHESEEYLRYNKNDKHDYEFNYEELCSEIYNRLYCTQFIGNEYKKVNYEQFYDFSIYTESRLELNNQYLDDEIHETLEYLRKNKIKMGIVSDFYHSRQFLTKCLRNLGIDLYFEKVFVSCEYKLSKSSGSLYPAVLKEIKENPNEIIMVGDNEKADYLNSKTYKINAYYKKYDSCRKEFDKQKIIEKMINLANERECESYPYSNYAFSIFLFTDRLYRKIKEKNIDKIFFLSREGEELKRYFDYYCREINDESIKTYYVYVSRVATFGASLKDLQSEDFDTLFREFNNMSPMSFLKNFNIPDNDICEICKQICVDCNSKIKNFKNSKEFKKIIDNEMFINYYEMNRCRQKKNFKGYLNQFNIDYEKEGMNLVDIGWKGTIQDNIYNFFEGKVHLRGFYLGLNNPGSLSGKNEKFGILFSIYPYRSNYFNIYNLDFTFYERLLFASHGSVLSYEKEQDQTYYPKTYLYEREKGKKALIEPIQKSIFKKYKKICEYFISSILKPEEIEDVFANQHIKAILEIKKCNIIIQQMMLDSHIENFGYFNYANKANDGVLIKKYKSNNFRNKLLLLYKIFTNKSKLLYFIFILNRKCAKHSLFLVNKINCKLIEINIKKFK